MPKQRFTINADFSRRVLDGLVTALVVIDRKLRVTFMNSAAEMLFGISFRQAKGIGFQNLALGTETLSEGLQRCLDSGYPYTERELSLVPPNAQSATVDCTVTPLHEKEQPGGLILEIHQIDRQLRINREEYMLAQHNTSRALVRNLAHEIKNPLGGLRGAAQLLEHELPAPELRDYTRIIIGEADRLRNLVDRMLGPNQLPVYVDVNIHQILERVRSLTLAEGMPKLAIRQDYDPSIPLLRGDPDQLIQAVLNIVGNAVQALEGDGVITLRTRILRQVTIRQQRYKLVVCVEIIDDGPGIPEALQEEIFYPMISGRAEGTGLGLSIAQILVTQHGGLIECRSRPGKTVFTILLPLECCHD